MTLRHWTLLLVGLAAWAVLALVWATGPYDCQAPDASQHVSCRR